MVNKEKKSILYRLFFSRGFVVLIGLLVVSLGVGYFNTALHTDSVEQEVARLEQELGERKNRRLESLDYLAYVKSDRYVEEKARTELNLIRPGENVIVLSVDTPYGESVDGSVGGPTGQKLSNPLKWWYYLTRRKT
jgi:cell division protein FtsB